MLGGGGASCPCLSFTCSVVSNTRLSDETTTETEPPFSACQGLPRWLSGNESACQCRRHLILGQEDTLEEEMATQSNILVWKIPWIEEPGGLQCMGLQRVIYY